MKEILTNLTQRWPSVALGGAAILAGTALAFTQSPTTSADAKVTPVNLALDERPVSRDTAGRASFAPVIKKVSQAVVKVSVTLKAQKTGFGEGQDPNDLMRRFFGEQAQPGDGRQSRRGFSVPREQGVGSGVIVTKDGYILTNNHVVENADEVKVAMQDGREFTAKVIGRDPKSDVAVIKIEAKELPVVTMADSEKVEVGDIVLAIGNPFGIGQTVTTGIVSAKDRGNMGLDYEDFIQTDAAINPGNSGGALVDADGRLIGINTAILSRTGGNQGIGFAIPVNMAKDVMQGLVKDGHVTRGYLGVSIQDLTPALAKEFQIKGNAAGALVGDVTEGSPAEKAGLKSGDLITEFNSHKVTDSRRLKLEVARTAPGASVPVKVLRDGSSKTLAVQVKAVPGTEKIAKADAKDGDTGTLNGVGVADLDAKARERFKVPETVKGAIVTQVEPNSAAAEAGLKPGDVILEINRKPVKDAGSAIQMTETASAKTSLLRIWRAGGSHFMVVDESKAG
jgi:serine protease Do